MHISPLTPTSSYMKMDLHKRTMLRKLRRFFRRILCALGMVPVHPKIGGLFTAYGTLSPFHFSVEPWYLDYILKNPHTYDCTVVDVGRYKEKNGVKHEFLRFEISSPDKCHTCILIAERNGAGGNAHRDPCDSTRTTDNNASTDTVSGSVAPLCANGDSTKPGLSSSFSSSSRWAADDLIRCATLGCTAGDRLEEKCKRATRICTLTFSEKARPSANELGTLLYLTSKLEPTYTVTSTQCYWYAKTVFTALETLFVDAKPNVAKHPGGTCYGVSVPTKESVGEVCDKYREARDALALEVANRRGLEREQAEERRREPQAAEEERQREHEQLQAAEARARAAEEERQTERERRLAADERARAAEEEIARLRKFNETVWRATPSTQQL
ncbi:hypothetical protein EDD16DRAFT_1687418 [Pisolithus croceorrhizus]|nr:hypothetical protein EDD16DRAFT_1687418 [Pisolithus croceorrhizus]